MNSCNTCIYDDNGICQNDGCSFDFDDNCIDYESRATFESGYQQGRLDAIKVIEAAKLSAFFTLANSNVERLDFAYEIVGDILDWIVAKLKEQKDE